MQDPRNTTAGRSAPLAGESLADRWVDELVPDDLDWRHLVRRYPMASMAVATTAGFLLGRNHGAALLAAVSAYAVREVSSNLTSAFGGTAPGDGV